MRKRSKDDAETNNRFTTTCESHRINDRREEKRANNLGCTEK